jgi:hypothetical protein
LDTKFSLTRWFTSNAACPGESISWPELSQPLQELWSALQICSPSLFLTAMRIWR